MSKRPRPRPFVPIPKHRPFPGRWPALAVVAAAVLGWVLIFQLGRGLLPAPAALPPTIQSVAASVWRMTNEAADATATAFPIRHGEGRTYFLTAAHNFDFRGMQFPPWAEKPHPCDAVILGERRLPILGSILNDHADVALFWVAGEEIPLLALRQAPVEPQEEVYAFGFSHGFGMLVRHGWCGAVTEEGSLIHSAIVMPGDSGGPLVDLQFRVVGVIQARQDCVGVSTAVVSFWEWLPVQLFNASRR